MYSLYIDLQEKMVIIDKFLLDSIITFYKNPLMIYYIFNKKILENSFYFSDKPIHKKCSCNIIFKIILFFIILIYSIIICFINEEKEIVLFSIIFIIFIIEFPIQITSFALYPLYRLCKEEEKGINLYDIINKNMRSFKIINKIIFFCYFFFH